MADAAIGDSQAKQVRLEELLPSDAIEKLSPVMQKISAGKLDISKGKEAILEILQPHQAELLAKGVLDAYLAWYLTALAARQGGRL